MQWKHTLISEGMPQARGSLLPASVMWGLWVVVFFGALFMFPNFYWLDSHNEVCVAIASLWWIISKNQIENQTFHDVVMDVGSARYIDFWLNKESNHNVERMLRYIMFVVECGVVNRMWRRSLLNMCLYSVCFFDVFLFSPKPFTNQYTICLVSKKNTK